MSEVRVVLVKPGDVLVFGNVCDVWGDDDGVAFGAALKAVSRATGVAEIVIFAADIDMASIPACREEPSPPHSLEATSKESD